MIGENNNRTIKKKKIWVDETKNCVTFWVNAIVIVLISLVNLDIISPEGVESKYCSFKSSILKYRSFLKDLEVYWAVFVIKTVCKT